MAILLVLIASAITIRQSTRPEGVGPPRALLSLSWWRYPLEWNVTNRLLAIGVDLNAIQVAPNTSHVWAAGSQGMVVVSSDGGNTWERRGIKADQVVYPPPAPTPLPIGTSPTRSLVSIEFADANRGVAMGEQHEEFTTTDGGTSWSRLFIYDSLDIFGRRKRDPILDADLRAFQWWPGLAPENRSDFDSRFYIAITSQGVPYRVLPHMPSEIEQSAFRDVNLPAYNVQITRQGKVWVVGGYGRIWSADYWGYAGQARPAPSTDDLHAVFFLDETLGWVAGSNGAIFVTYDNGNNWQRQHSGTRSQLNAIYFLPDGKRGWIAGNDGLILSTDDGGATWVHRTQGKDAAGIYLRFPAPWFFVVLLIAGTLLMRRPREQTPESEESVADVLVSDRPLDTSAGDVLAFNSIALGLSRFLRNENTMPPLTIAIIGEWGTGKSSLMNLLRADLRSYKFRPVWFNAWHHQKEEHMLASLLENIKLQAVPRWWSNRGLGFRAKLLAIRGWRHWLPLVLLLFFIYVLLIYHFGREGTDASYAGLMSWLTAAVSHPVDTAQKLVPVVPLVAGIGAFLGAVWRGITAFGVKPASLLARVSSGSSIRGLEAQTSFRQKFAVEFNDVTRALGKRSLLIFIDDLDRCRPENVLETLEAVNFLTTSGECFVIIGMAREYVERCVGRAFKDIAEEMIDNVDKPQSANGEDQSPDELAKEKRIEFARQYLDKLINIEVPIPVAKQAQSLNLLLAGAYQPSEPEPKSRWQEFKFSITGGLARHWRVLPALSALIALSTLGYFLAFSLIAQSPGDQLSPTPDSSSSPPQAARGASPARESRTPTPSAAAAALSPRPSPLPAPTAELVREPAEITAGERGPFSRGFLPAIALLGMIWLGVTVLTRRPDLVVKDSPNFVDALKIWHPLIHSRQSTPRTIKRFMNRIRYLAMRQRSPADPQLSWFGRLFGTKGQPVGVRGEAGSAVAEAPSEIIPDEALVALAALEHFNRQYFLSLGLGASKLALASAASAAVKYAGLDHALVGTVLKTHEKRFGKLGVLKYRDRYLEMSASVEVR